MTNWLDRIKKYIIMFLLAAFINYMVFKNTVEVEENILLQNLI